MIPGNQNPKGAVYKVTLEVRPPKAGVDWVSFNQEITAMENGISIEIQ